MPLDGGQPLWVPSLFVHELPVATPDATSLLGKIGGHIVEWRIVTYPAAPVTTAFLPAKRPLGVVWREPILFSEAVLRGQDDQMRRDKDVQVRVLL